MTRCHLLYCPFTGLGLRDGYRGRRWLKNRIRVFRRFVVPSLLNQRDGDFVLWVSWRPQEATNPQVTRLADWLRGLPGLRVVFTFHGLCYWDDKYPDTVAATRLRASLAGTLPELTAIVAPAETVEMTIQSSDDLYALDMVESVRERWPDGAQAMAFTRGYVMNYRTKALAEYDPTTCPPFFTIRFPRDVFLDAERHFAYTGPYKSHEYVGEALRLGKWDGRGFCVGTHGANISTTWRHPFRGRSIVGAEREAVMSRFGVANSPPVVIWSALPRAAFDALPPVATSVLRRAYRAVHPRHQG
jgi:hypothetical protein